MSDSEVNTTQDVEIPLENATALLRDEDVEVLAQLNSADDVAQNMEEKLDAVLSDLDRLLAQLESGDMNGPTLNSHEDPKSEITTRET
jgi:3-dehydroquinate synthase class II